MAGMETPARSRSVTGGFWNSLAGKLLEGFLATAAQCVQPPSACSSTKTSLGFGKKPAGKYGHASASARNRGRADSRDCRGGAAARRETQGRFLRRALPPCHAGQYRLLRTAWKLTERDSLALLGSGLEAHRSVVTASACFAIAPNSYEKTIAQAMAAEMTPIP